MDHAERGVEKERAAAERAANRGSQRGTAAAVLENEFGAVGIDDELLKANTKMQSEDEIIEMMNGCICCTALRRVWKFRGGARLDAPPTLRVLRSPNGNPTVGEWLSLPL